MKVYVEHFMAAASHMDYFVDEIDVTLRVAFRLWLSTFSPRAWSSSDDTAGNQMLEKILQTQDPAHRYPVSAVLLIRPLWWWKGLEKFKSFILHTVLRMKKEEES